MPDMPYMPPSPQQQVINLINKSEKILILPSSPPDGDSLGSAIALYLVLTKLKKEVTVVCADPVPEALQFLPKEEVIQDEFHANRDFLITVDCSNANVKDIKHTVENGKVNIVITPEKREISEKNVTFHHGNAKYDLIIIVDAGDLEQLGHLYEDHTEFFFTVPVINIDHHPSNNGFGKVNLVDVAASSTTEIIFELIQEMDTQKNLIDPDTATALLAGIITDTGSFQNANTTPRAMETSAELVDLGAAQQDIIKNVYKTKHLSTLKLWGKILTKLKTDERHRIIWSALSREDFKETESTLDETGGIIDELMSNAPDVEVVLLLKEREPGLVSGSIRTTNDSVNASKIAALFGGGGHLRAAGFRIHGKELEAVEREVLEGIRKFQQERLHLEEEEMVEKTEAAAKVKEPAAKVTEAASKVTEAASKVKEAKIEIKAGEIETGKPEMEMKAPEPEIPKEAPVESPLESTKNTEPTEAEVPEATEPEPVELPTEEPEQAQPEPEPVEAEVPEATEPEPVELQTEEPEQAQPEPEPVRPEPKSATESEPAHPEPEQPEPEQPEPEQAQPEPEPVELQTEEPQAEKSKKEEPKIDIAASKIFGHQKEAPESYEYKLPPELSAKTPKKKPKTVEDDIDIPYSFGTG